MNKKLAVIPVIVAAVISLTGCAQIQLGAGNPDFTIEKTSAENSNFEPNALVTSNTEVVITLGGSSSCPPEIKKVTVDKEIVTVHQKKLPNRPCTADYGMFGNKVTAADSTFNFTGKIFELCVDGVCSPLPMGDSRTS